MGVTWVINEVEACSPRVMVNELGCSGRTGLKPFQGPAAPVRLTALYDCSPLLVTVITLHTN